MLYKILSNPRISNLMDDDNIFVWVNINKEAILLPVDRTPG